MDMLLRHVSVRELGSIFARHADRSPAPYLTDPSCVRRARRLAKKNGIWDELSRGLDPTRDIPVLKRSHYRHFQRVGDRSLPQRGPGERRKELARAAMALWLDHPRADVDYLQDLVWAYCDDWTWVMAAHERCAIDLGSAALSAGLAEIVHVLGHRLEDEVKARVAAEIERRTFLPLWDYGRGDMWQGCRMNWNHVCNGSIIRAALYQLADPQALARVVHLCVQDMTYALDGFTDDGGCEEGPGYWAYGFGHFLEAAHALHCKTDGKLNIATGDKIARISRYPLATHIHGPLRSVFADASHGYVPSLTAMLANHFHPVPELYDLCALHPDRTVRLSTMHELALYAGAKATGEPDHRDYLLPDLGQVKLRGAPGAKQITLLAIAGHNGVNHNHNDIGSFIVARRGRLLLVDPGGPTYTRKTFSPQRYEIVFCNSRGHSVPVINGHMQIPGREHYGVLRVANLNGSGPKEAVVDMTHAYAEGTVKQLVRTFTLDPASNHLMVEDAYEFGRAPRSVEEAFITFESAAIAAGGRSVQIGPKRGGVRLAAVEGAGRFTAERLVEESKEGRSGEVITRLVFTAKKLAKTMRLAFEIA